jgi:probable enterotoxin D
MLPINKQLISINYSKGVVINPSFIVIHETDNEDVGANAMANRNYFANHSEAQASTHFIVDDKNIIQCLELNQRGWHVGDNRGHSNINNSNTVGIEICVNRDGDYNRARANAIELTKYLMVILKLGADRVVRHYDSSGKHCPRKMLDNPALWNDFKAQLGGSAPTATVVNNVVASAPTSTPSNVQKCDAYGNVTASVLNVRNEPSTNGSILGTLPKDTKVHIGGKLNGWYNIFFGSNGGWVSGEYINLSSGSSTSAPVDTGKYGTVTANSGLNVRSGPGTGYKVIGSLSKGQKIRIGSHTSGWYNIYFGDHGGWVSDQYLQV